MRPYLFEFRELFYEFPSGNAAFERFLRPWAYRNSAILQPYFEFRHFNGPENPYRVEANDLDSLYALSRVCDLMIGPLEPSGLGAAKWSLAPHQFVDFWETLGLSSHEPNDFDPFWCEIAAIEAAPSPDAAPQIEEVFWPALRFGDLLICRAGVRISAGKKLFNPEIAATSPLYFTFRRASRPTHDLSHGWGHNSQWSTSFRRDYVWRDFTIFNADGAINGNRPAFLSDPALNATPELPSHRFFASDKGDNGGLNLSQREELLTHRCFVNHQPREDDFWPYDDTLLLQIKSL